MSSCKPCRNCVFYPQNITLREIYKQNKTHSRHHKTFWQIGTRPLSEAPLPPLNRLSLSQREQIWYKHDWQSWRLHYLKSSRCQQKRTCTALQMGSGSFMNTEYSGGYCDTTVRNRAKDFFTWDWAYIYTYLTPHGLRLCILEGVFFFLPPLSLKNEPANLPSGKA